MRGDDKPHLSSPTTAVHNYGITVNYAASIQLGQSGRMGDLLPEAAIELEDVIRICTQLASEGVTPSAGKVKQRAGLGGSLSTYQAGVNKWKALVARRAITGIETGLPPEIVALTQQLMESAREQAREELSEQRAALQAQQEELQRRTDHASARQQAAESELLSCKQIRDRLEQHVATLEAVVRTRDQSIQQHENDATELRGRFESQQAELESLNARLAASESRTHKLQAELTSSMEREAALNDMLDAARSDAEKRSQDASQEIESMKQAAERTSKQFAKQVEKLEKQLSNLQGKLEREQLKHTETQVKLAQASSRADTLQEQAQFLIASIQRKEDEMKVAQAQWRELERSHEGELKDMRADLRALKRELKESQAENRRLARVIKTQSTNK